MIKRGRPRKYERGTCEGMDEAGHPEGYWVRCGKGLPPFAFEQDCAIYEENKDRIQVIEHMTEAGVAIPVIRIIGDGVDASGKMRTGGAYVLRPLDNPATWESGQGVRQRVVFSPQSPIQQDWYFNVELRGELSFKAKNEGSSCVLVAIKNEVVKVAWYRDAKDGDGGGQRIVKEFPYTFKRWRWYDLEIETAPVYYEDNTWRLFVSLQDKKRPKNAITYSSSVEECPNRIKSVTMVGMGDEQQGLDSGGTFDVSVCEDAAIEQER